LPTVAVILAWDAASLPGSADPKLLAPLAGRPILEHSIAAFDDAPGVDEILVAAAPGMTGPASGMLSARHTPSRVIDSGTTRIEAARRAITALGGTSGNVLIHDAARPLLSQRVIEECLSALGTAEAVCAAVPASDTMVTTRDFFVQERPRRDRLRRRQSPQGFRLPLIRRGYELAAADPDFKPADDCAIVLRYLPEVPIRLVQGSEQLFPITRSLDLDIAETMMRAKLP
jgi:ribitol-5-phosphate 2-dehydrogenase (NADP+) / D-ribitol-5-phosphate cytidylyltransferase